MVGPGQLDGQFSKAAQLEFGDSRIKDRVQGISLDDTDGSRRRSLRLLERAVPDEHTLQGNTVSIDGTDFEGDTINRRRIYVQSTGRSAAAETPD